MILSVSLTGSGMVETYQLKPIRFPMRLDELVDIPTDHPFRHHCELVFAHRNAQKRQQIRMAKSGPCHNLFTEPLRGSALDGQRTVLVGQ